MNQILYHHGIKGQRWGVRRYQNPDGSLTPAGKARYYTDDGRDNLLKLSSAGRQFNREQNRRFKTYANSVAKDARTRNGEQYESAKRRYLAAAQKNHEYYMSELEKWNAQEGEYKGKDYYQFKDIARDKWLTTKDAEQEEKAMHEIKSMIEASAKESPLWSATLSELSEYSFKDSAHIRTVSYGERVVNSVFNSTVRLEAIKRQK